ncbi:hypothetical protein [Nocardioides convexus]|uniref:hypothetical protein n=1 Tax=Nocardioides convexus TaxID=2712224 RepID=UPI00241815C5|nr:hypothetical protein [Nocardioides convexus]
MSRPSWKGEFALMARSTGSHGRRASSTRTPSSSEEIPTWTCIPQVPAGRARLAVGVDHGEVTVVARGPRREDGERAGAGGGGAQTGAVGGLGRQCPATHEVVAQARRSR